MLPASLPLYLYMHPGIRASCKMPSAYVLICVLRCRPSPEQRWPWGVPLQPLLSATRGVRRLRSAASSSTTWSSRLLTLRLMSFGEMGLYQPACCQCTRQWALLAASDLRQQAANIRAQVSWWWTLSVTVCQLPAQQESHDAPCCMGACSVDQQDSKLHVVQHLSAGAGALCAAGGGHAMLASILS